VKPFFHYVLRQGVLVNLLFMLSMAVGFFALFDLPIERYPNVHMGKIQITTIFPSASPEEVEALVSREIEEALDNLESVEFIQSTSYRERSVIIVKFIDDTDYEQLYDELRLKVLSIMNELPKGIDPPVFTEINVDQWLPAVAVVSGLTDADAIAFSLSNLHRAGLVSTEWASFNLVLGALSNTFMKLFLVLTLGHRELFRHLLVAFVIIGAAGIFAMALHYDLSQALQFEGVPAVPGMAN